MKNSTSAILMGVVSRTIAIASLLLFAGDTILPAFFVDSQSTLPACCRRDGKHHCAMMEMSERQQDNASPFWKDVARKCPMFPKGTVASCVIHSAPLPSVAVIGLLANQPVGRAQTEVLCRISHSRSREKRGPPSLV